jgi:hypothetical protein
MVAFRTKGTVNDEKLGHFGDEDRFGGFMILYSGA